MTADDSHSLADQAAAWVPPWARTPTDPTEPADRVEPVEPVEPAVVDPAEPAGEPMGAVEPLAEEVVAVQAAPVVLADADEVVADAEPVVLAEGEAVVGVEAEPVVSADGEAVVGVEAEPVVLAEGEAVVGVEAEPVVLAEGEAVVGVEAEPVIPAGAGVSAEDEAGGPAEVGAEPGAGDAPSGGYPSDGLFEVVPVETEPVKAELSAEELRGAVEAIMLIVDEPATEIVLAQVLDQPVDRIAGVLGGLADEYTRTGRGFELRRVAGGWRLYTRPEFAPYVEKFVLDGQQVRLTQAALETLAVVAYKQPVTRSRISAIRGVNCDGVVRTLVARGLIEECGSEPESGAFLYRTTILFLEKLGLDSVDQLPSLAPFLPDDVDEIADAQR